MTFRQRRAVTLMAPGYNGRVVGLRAAWVMMSLGAAACVRDPTVACGERSCPAGTVCVAGGCATPEQLAACAGMTEGSPCSAPAVANGACVGQVCVAVVCGDGAVFGGEVCDDGNERSGDGCSADCQSLETCGNGYVDTLAGEECDDGDLAAGDGCTSVCSIEAATWIDVSPRAPSVRIDHAMAYDEAREYTLMFGGASDGLQLDETWAWDGVTWRELGGAPRPPPREDAAMAFDAARGEIVLHGGVDRNDTWVWDGVRWEERTGAPRPPPRANMAMAYDPTIERIVLVVGAEGAQNGMTWEWDGVTWSGGMGNSATPDAVRPHQVTYNPLRERLEMVSGGASYDRVNGRWTDTGAPPGVPRSGSVLVGGARGAFLVAGASGLADTLVHASSGWLSLSTVLPESRNHGGAYDRRFNRPVIFGGSFEQVRHLNAANQWVEVTVPNVPGTTNSLVLVYQPARGTVLALAPGETSEWDGAWRSIATPAPQARSAAGAARRADVIVFGGLDPTTREPTDQTHRWDGETWEELDPAVRPPARSGAMATYDAARDRVVLFGGEGAAGRLGDTWEWDGTGWSRVSSTGPDPRQQGTLAYDSTRRETVLFGGDTLGGPVADTWVWDGTSWRERTPATSPPARFGHAAAFDAERGRMVMSGGQAAARVLGDSWEWDGTTWRALAVATGPGPRVGHGLAYDPIRHQVLGYGGGFGTPSSLRLQTVARRFSSQVSGPDACHDLDTDGDSLVGCDDPDCWARCTPSCPPGGPCDPDAPRCGDGACNPMLENHRLCPADCMP